MATVAAGGTAVFRIDGVQYQARGALKLEVLNLERTGGRNIDGSFYFTEKYVPASIEVEISDSSGLSVASFEGFVNEDVTAELVNGKVYGLNEAVFIGKADLDAVDGKFTARFEGIMSEVQP